MPQVRIGIFGMRAVLTPVQFVGADEKAKTLVLKKETLAPHPSPKQLDPRKLPGRKVSSSITHRRTSYTCT
jgi:hypothetical protein